MNELDKRIREALQKEDAELFEDFGGEPSIFEMLMETCRGRHRWLNILGAFWTFVFLVLGVLAAIKFWALAHLIANGDLASMILFASFLAYAVYDRISLKDRKPTALIGVPGSGPPRNDVIAIVLGLALYAVFLLWLHPLLIGTSPMP